MQSQIATAGAMAATIGHLQMELDATQTDEVQPMMARDGDGDVMTPTRRDVEMLLSECSRGAANISTEPCATEHLQMGSTEMLPDAGRTDAHAWDHRNDASEVCSPSNSLYENMSEISTIPEAPVSSSCMLFTTNFIIVLF